MLIIQSLYYYGSENNDILKNHILRQVFTLCGRKCKEFNLNEKAAIQHRTN